MKNNFLEVPSAQRAGALAVIAGTDPREAEKAICLLANQQGDSAVAELLSETEPIAVAAILCGHDVSSPTIAYQLLEPEKVIAALEVSPSLWAPVDSNERLWEEQKATLQMLFGFFHEAAPCRIGEILDLLRENDQAMNMLHFVFADWNPRDEEWEGIDPASSEEDEGCVASLLEAAETSRLIFNAGSTGHFFELIREVDSGFAKELLQWCLDIKENDGESNAWNMANDLIAACKKNKKGGTAKGSIFEPLP
jgi:hypothetical protein